MGGARVGMGRSGSRKCAPTMRPKSAAHMERAHTCDLNPEASPEPEPDKGDVEDTGDTRAEAKAACPQGSNVDRERQRTHPMTSRVGDVDANKKTG